MNALKSQLMQSVKDGFKKVDYSKWERSDRKRDLGPTTKSVMWASLPPMPRTISSHKHEAFPAVYKQVKKDRAGKSGPSTARVDSTVVFVDSHSRRKKTPERNDISLKKEDNIKILQLLIKLRKTSISKMESHCAVLLESNREMAREIVDTDRNSFSSAKDCLIRHERLGNSIGALNGWSHGQICQVKCELRDVEDAAKKHLNELQEQLSGVLAEMEKAQAELHAIKTYKDKEYLLKTLRIAEMKREVERLRETQQDEYEDVSLLCQTEMVNLKRRSKQMEDDILSAIAKQKLSRIPSIIPPMFVHNCTMKKEIDIHEKAIKQLDEEIRELVKTVQELQLSQTSARKERFRQVFPNVDKYVKMYSRYGYNTRHSRRRMVANLMGPNVEEL